MITTIKDKFYFFDEKLKRHGPYEDMDSLKNAIRNHAEIVKGGIPRLENELQRQSN